MASNGPAKVRCPECGKRVKVSDADAGQAVVCPACGGRVDVPHAPLLGPVSRPPPVPQAGGLATVAGPQPVGTVTTAAADEELVPLQTEQAVLAAAQMPAGQVVAPAGPVVVPSAPVSAPATPPALLPPVGFPVRKPGPPANPAPMRDEDRTTIEDGEDRRRGMHPLWWIFIGAPACALVVAAVMVAFGRFDPWENKHRAILVELKGRAESLAAADDLQGALDAYRQLDDLSDGRVLRDPELKKLVEAAKADRQKVYSILLARKMAQAKARASQGPQASPRSVGPSAVAVVPAPNPATTVKPPPRPPVQPGTVQPPPDKSRPRANPPPDQAGDGGARPDPRPAPPDPVAMTDDRVGDVIQKGVDYLLDQFDPDTHRLRNDQGDRSHYAGLDALAVYALLQSGQAINDPRLNVRGPQMRAMLDELKAMPIGGGSETYARALRATCLALFNRPEDLKTLQDDADYLLGTCDNGAYTYSAKRSPPYRRVFTGKGQGWDNSNSQYGLLGVWTANDAEPSIEVPRAYWDAVQKHWTDCQLGDGQWGYTSGGGRLSMTCAGLASLFVTQEYTDPSIRNYGGFDAAREGLTSRQPTVGREPYSPALKKGLNWFERGDNALDLPNHWWGYALYGIERVGLASGFKQFGTHDWYRELSAEAVRKQGRRGDWGDGIVDTSYALLFLSRGRHPILMNKLRFDRRGEVASAPGTYWCNRTRDVANAARFAGRVLERPINWQVVSVENPWQDWADSPILYIASHEPPRLADDDYANLKAFVDAGGMIFTHADPLPVPLGGPGPAAPDLGSPTFTAWAEALARRLFPDYEMADLPADHPIHTIVFRPNPRPRLRAVSNGSRVLMLHSPNDIALRWQQRQDRPWEARGGTTRAPTTPEGEAKKAADLAPFQFAVNLFVYAAGKRDLRNRLETPWVSAPGGPALYRVGVARLQYAGNWDPEPGAWRRYANWFQRQTSYAVDVRPVKLADLKAADAAAVPFAHLTGTARQDFTDAEATALRSYVEAGGVVLIDATGGTGPFVDNVRKLLQSAFPPELPIVVGSDHPLLAGLAPGMDDLPARPRLRQFTLERMGSHAGMPALVKSGKGHVLVTNLDLTSGLLGTRTWGILGYEPSYSQSLLKNALLWTLDGQPDKEPKADPAGDKATAAAGGAGE